MSSIKLYVRLSIKQKYKMRKETKKNHMQIKEEETKKNI